LLQDRSIEDDNLIILTEPMRDSEVSQRCIGADGEPGCVLQLIVQASPGIDAELTGIELESNIVLNYSRDLSDPLTHDEMHTPNTEVTTEWWLDGVSPEQDDALAGDDHIQIAYAIKPIGLGQAWLPMTVHETDNLSPVGHALQESVDDIQAGAEIHFTDSLFIEGETFAAVGPGGAWEEENHFELRACLSTSFTEPDLPVEDEAANNCVYAPFFLTERLTYNPDAYENSANPASALMSSKVAALEQDNSFTEYKGLYKKWEVSSGDADSLKIGASLLNQARFGVSGRYDEVSGLPLPGSGVPFAAFGATLEAYLEGFLDAELLLVDFTHTITHKEPSDSADWDYARSYKPSVMFHMFGIHFVDVVGSLPLEGEIAIDNEDLEKLSKLFVKDEDGAPPDDNEISFAQALCDKTGIDALVMELSVNICATGDSGVQYGLTLSSAGADPENPFVAPFENAASLISATAWVDPYAELDLQGSVTVDLGLLKGDLITTVALMKLHLIHQDSYGEYQKGGAFNLATAAENEFVNLGVIGTEAYLEEEILNGAIKFEGERVNGVTIACCFYPKATWKSVARELYSWDGISIGRQKLWNLARTDTVTVDPL